VWCVAGPYAISRAIGQLSASEIPVPSLGSLRQVLVRQKLGHDGAERNVANQPAYSNIEVSTGWNRRNSSMWRVVFTCSNSG